ncbi:MAG TPA: protein-glutamate O-methyltransferase CheR [Opitutaceae bacterium]|jgi:chemotaxis protein methyltransferase CheR|nr:protein-glutamate O-methyltransferase CheR [Opitutaceae bacterium]
MIPAFPPEAPPPLSAPEPVPMLLRDLIHERIGIFFDPDRLDTMLDKLAPRARLHGCRSYLDYYYILKYEEKGREEWLRVMDCFSVQETFFWREFDQMRAVVDMLVPAWFRAHDRPLRIWSAACASGEEPYSLAMALIESGWGAHPIEIVATDASEEALARARVAYFRERSFRALPPELRARYFLAKGEGYILHPEVVSRVDFRWANLLDLEGTAAPEKVEVIFCRNVFIYFSPASIARVVGSFARRIAPAGHLFVGASESLNKLTADFSLQELGSAFVYRHQPLP